DLRPQGPKGHVAPPPPPTIRQGPTAPPAPVPVETTARPKTGGAGAPAVTGYSGGHPPSATGQPQNGQPAAQGLPGEPANRLAPGRGPKGPARPDQTEGQSK